MNKIIILILLQLCNTIINAQTLSQTTNRSSALLFGNIEKGEVVMSSQEKKGNSFPSQISIDIATKDKKLEVENQYCFQINTLTFIHFGMSTSAKMNNSIANFYNNNNVVGGNEGSILFGIKIFDIKNEKDVSEFFVKNINNYSPSELKEKIGEIGKIRGHWLFINPSIESREFQMIKTDSIFNEQISKMHNSLWSINIGYNYWDSNILGFTTILGLSFTSKYSDNFSDLTEISVVEQQQSTSGSIQRLSLSEITVYDGNYTLSKKNDANIEIYLIPYELSTFGLYLGHQTTFEKRKKSYSCFSTGFYFSKLKQPTNPSLGVIFTFNDIYDNHDLNAEKKFTINLVTRLNISKAFR